MRGKGVLLDYVVRLVLGGAFLYAGFVKIGEPSGFAGSIAAYRLLPYFGNYLAAAVLPWLEALCGVLLIAGYRPRAAASLVLVLTLAFMAVLVSALARGLDIDCGCFRHGGGKTSAWTALARDSILLAMALVVLRDSGQRRSLWFSGK
ncbi:MAG TPA: MauE/DoxX family redox-associated membrane protein [Geobacteraceae bacterium]